MFTEDLLADLCAREDRPWREWSHANRPTAVQLAKLLKPFGIRPRSMRGGGGNAKGYELAAFADAFGRYLPADPSQPSQFNADAGLTDAPSGHSFGSATDRGSCPNPYGAGFVTV